MKHFFASKELHVGVLLALSQKSTSIMRDPVLTSYTSIYEDTSLQYVLFNWINYPTKSYASRYFYVTLHHLTTAMTRSDAVFMYINKTYRLWVGKYKIRKTLARPMHFYTQCTSLTLLSSGFWTPMVQFLTL